MHSIFRAFALLLMVAFAAVSFDSSAQAAAAPDDVKDPPAKAQPAKKPEAAKPAAAPKKFVAKKSVTAKAAAKPEVATPKTPVTTPGISPNPDFTVYKAGQSPPNLQGKDGKVIPSNPDAYDVSSGMGKKK